jgi:ribosomal protein S18 acetylase RimI-like enzyme
VKASLKTVLKSDEEYERLVEASLSTLSRTHNVGRNQGAGGFTYSVRSRNVEYKVYVGRNIVEVPPVTREKVIIISWGSLPAPFILVPSFNKTYFDLTFEVHSAHLDGIPLQLKRCLEENGCRLVGFSADASSLEARSKSTRVTRAPKFLYSKLSRRYHSTRDLLSMKLTLTIARRITRKDFPAFDGEGEIVIREAREDDLSQIFGRFGEIFLVRPRHRMMRRHLRYFGETFLVAQREGRIIGFSFCSLSLTFKRFRFGVDGSLNNIGVVDEHRKSGVGSRLLDQTIRRLTAMGVGSLHVAVDSDNLGAISMYRHAGFEETKMLSEGQREYTLQLGKNV